MDWFLTSLTARPYNGEMPSFPLEDLMAKLSSYEELIKVILLVVVFVVIIFVTALFKKAIERLGVAFFFLVMPNLMLILNRLFVDPPPLGDFIIALIAFNLVGVGSIFLLASFLHLLLPERDD